MAYTLQTNLSLKANYGSSRSTSKIKYIVIHYTAGDGDTANANAKHFATKVTKTSAHYFVDDNYVTQSVPDNYVAYSVGGKKWNDCAKTGGGKLYGIVCNTNSLSIEMCDTEKNGVYNVSTKTLNNVIQLTKTLMKKYNVDIDHVVRHFDVNGKHCPAYYMDEKAWAGFKAKVANALVESVTKEEATVVTGNSYDYNNFIVDCRRVLGLPYNATAAQVLAKTVTLSRTTNKNHALVTPWQRLLKSLGYYTGDIEEDLGKKPSFGPGMEKAVKKFQTYVVKPARVANIDGVISAKGMSWKKALKM